MGSPRLKGVVAGLGVMGSFHLRVLSQMPEDVEVVAAVDPDPETRARIAGLYPSVAVHATLAEALAGNRPDFAALAAPVEQLPALAAEAFGAGVACMVEKPLAADEDAALEIIRAAESAGA